MRSKQYAPRFDRKARAEIRRTLRRKEDKHPHTEDELCTTQHYSQTQSRVGS